MVNETVAVTPVAAAKLLDNKIEGKESSEEIIAGYVPVTLAPTMVAPSLAVVAAEILVMAV